MGRVVSVDTWPCAPVLRGTLIELEPLREDHAVEMAPLLDDSRLHAFIGGQSATPTQLQQRYRQQALGRSPDGTQRWLNWVVRRSEDQSAVGTVQATVTEDAGQVAVEVAWVIATNHQGQGFATDAARLMVTWLREHGAVTIVAHVHPEHAASAAIARSVGLTPSSTVEDGEVRWEG